MYVTEQQLTNQEVIERLQETVTLVDKLQEMENLERKLREVRDLEERLQEVDEMAERLQEVIEEELGKEEVDQLRKEVGGLEQQTQAEAITEMVLKKSMRRIEIKEDEVDELEDEIKRVFLKDLLPEEEEVEVEQVSKKEGTDGFSDGLREEKIGNEMKNEVEESDSSDVAGTMSVVAYQKVERRTKKRVTIVEERGLTQKEMEDVQPQTVVMSEVTMRQTGTVGDITERELTERLQPEDQSQVADEDVWFILFDRFPYKAAFKPLGKVFLIKTSLLL